MSYKFRISERLAKAIAVLMVVGGIVTPAASWVAAATQPRDPDANAVIWNGAYSKSEWANKVTHGDGHNSAANIQQIYFHEGWGISMSNMMDGSTVVGEVMKNGQVIVHAQKITVNGQAVTVDGVVADSAQSGGREFMAGSVKQGSLWVRSTQVSFASNSIPAWVNMSGGQFHFAVINSCGNPVKAHAVKVFKPAPPPTPVTTHTPTPVPTHTPPPTPPPTPVPTPPPTVVPTPVPTVVPTPVPTPLPTTRPQIICTSMAKNFISGSSWEFTMFHDVNDLDGAQITGYTWTFTHGSVTETQHTGPLENRVTHDVGAEGLNVQGQIQSTIGPSKQISNFCSASVPPQAQVLSATTTPPVIPATGPEAALGGMAGLTAIAVASRAYARSRKTLLGSLRRSGDR